MTDEEILKIVRLAELGLIKDIERKDKYGGAAFSKWHANGEAGLNFYQYDYRLKPQPREWFMALHYNGKITVSDRQDDFRVDAHACEVVKVREVVE